MEGNIEDLLGQLGKTGKYQWRQHILHFFVAFLSGMHMFSLTFIAPTPPHRCFISELDDVRIGLQHNATTTTTSTNMTSINIVIPFDKEILSQYIPMKANGELDSCHRYDSDRPPQFDSQPIKSRSSDDDDANNKTNKLPLSVKSCNGQFVYDTSIYQQSRVYDWNMVCENKWKRAFVQSIYVLGVFIGALFSGSLSDRYGRKVVLCVSGLLQFVFALSQPYFSNFVLYNFSLLFYGMFGSAGAFVTAYVMTMELVHKSNRAYCGAIFNSCFAIGACFVAIYGYLIRDITILQTVFALHAVVLFGYWWLLDESIRWLWSQGRITDAVKIASDAVKINGGSFTQNPSLVMLNKPQVINNRFGLSDLFFRLPIMRCRAIITAFNWFAISVCFYGLAFNTGNLPGNPYLVFFICAIADLPGFLLVVLLVNRTGRRALNSTLLFVGGLTCIITTIIPRGLLVTTLAMCAKVALAMCFAIVYNYTAELFPTVIRNSALGLCTMASRLGGMLTPQITLLNSIDKSIPTLVFGGMAILASFAFLFLPETLNKELPQTLEDGEKYGKGDTAFSRLCSKRNRLNQKSDGPNVGEKMLVQ